VPVPYEGREVHQLSITGEKRGSQNSLTGKKNVTVVDMVLQ